MLEAIDPMTPLRSSNPQSRGEGNAEFQRLWAQSGLEMAALPVMQAVQQAFAPEHVEDETADGIEENNEDQSLAEHTALNLSQTSPDSISDEHRDITPASVRIEAAFFDLKLHSIDMRSSVAAENIDPIQIRTAVTAQIEAVTGAHTQTPSVSAARPHLPAENAQPVQETIGFESGVDGVNVVTLAPAALTESGSPRPTEERTSPYPLLQPTAVVSRSAFEDASSSIQALATARFNRAVGDDSVSDPVIAAQNTSDDARTLSSQSNAGEGGEPEKTSLIALSASQHMPTKRALSNATNFPPSNAESERKNSSSVTQAEGKIDRSAFEGIENPVKTLHQSYQAPAVTTTMLTDSKQTLTASIGPAELQTQPSPSDVAPSKSELIAAAQNPHGGDAAPALQAAPQIKPAPPFAIAAQATRTDISNQIIAAAVDRASGTIELALTPEELGHLRIQLRPEGDMTRVILHASREETLEFLRRHASDLEQDLGASGFSNPKFSFEHDPSPPVEPETELNLLGPAELTPIDISVVRLGGKRLDLRL